jgi:hypothetical protein
MPAVAIARNGCVVEKSGALRFRGVIHEPGFLLVVNVVAANELFGTLVGVPQ